MNQLKSKERARDHGEVFTAEREVNAMLSLVHNETERIESRFLEPACGTGNFLVPILEKKIQMVRQKYGSSQVEFERNVVLAVSSIYGVDLLEDNVNTCRERLFNVVDNVYQSLYKKKCKEELKASIGFVLSRNILLGNALTLKTNDGNPILFSEWSLVRGSMVKRRDYTFDELIPKNIKDTQLFKELHLSDLGTPVFIPKSIKEYPLTHVLHLTHENNN